MTQTAVLIAQIALAIFGLLCFIPILVRWLPAKKSWGLIKSRIEHNETDWFSKFAGKLSPSQHASLKLLLKTICEPCNVSWKKLRPSDKLGPNLYRHWILDTNSIWSEIADTILIRDPKMSELVEQVWDAELDMFSIGKLIAAMELQQTKEPGARN